MQIDFTGKTIVVTGADHGLGRAIAQGFAACGAKPWICGLDAAKLAETAGGRMQTRVVDVGDRSAVQRFIAEIGREIGVEAPLVRKLVALIHDVEENRRPQSWDTLDALATETK